MATQIQFRRDIAINWTDTNPVLAEGELGYETDTKQFKIGDGTTAWNQLPYYDTGSSGSSSVNNIQELLSATQQGVITVLGYHTKDDDGGGIFYWDANKPKSEHNGGTIIDPNKMFPTNWSDQTQLNNWFTANTTTDLGCWIRLLNKDIFVEFFGAKGDGITDDTQAIQATINNSEKIYFMEKKYRITNTINIPSTSFIQGIPPSGSGWYALGSVIEVDSGFSGSRVFNCYNGYKQIVTGLEISNLYFNCNKVTVPIITIKAGYDHVTFRNITINNEYGRAIEVIPNDVSSTNISQTHYYENLLIIRGDNTNNKNDLFEPLFYAERLQEATFINCKFFAGKQVPANDGKIVSNSNGYCVKLVDSRGISFISTSFANSNHDAVVLTSVKRRSGYMTFTGCLWEVINGYLINATGASATDVNLMMYNIKVIMPRQETSHGYGFKIKNTKLSHFDSLNYDATSLIDTGCKYNVFYLNYSDTVTNNSGNETNTIIQFNNPYFYNSFTIPNNFYTKRNINAAGYIKGDIRDKSVTFANVKSQRAFSTTYHNSTNKGRFVAVSLESPTAGYVGIFISQDGNTFTPVSQGKYNTFAFVPAGWYYRVTASGTLYFWTEYNIL